MPCPREPIVWTAVLIAAFGWALATAGCGGGVCSRLGGCPAVDRGAAATDDVVELDDVGLATVGAGSTLQRLPIEGGEVIFAPEAPGCVPTAAVACRATVDRLSFRVADFELTTSDGRTAAVSNVVVSLTAPLVLLDEGAGYLLPSSAVFQTCATVDGRPQSATTTGASGGLNVYEATQDLSLDAAFVMALHEDDEDCTELQLAASAQVAGVKPWAQAPAR